MEPIPNNTEELAQPRKPHAIYFAVLAVILLFASSLIGFVILNESSTEESLLHTSDSSSTPPPSIDPRIHVRASIDHLSQEEFESEEAYYLGLSKTESPKIALAELRTNIETDQALLRSCHALTHSIGQDTYTRLQDFDLAMQYLDEVCNTGYMHGVIEAKFSASADIEHEVLTVCKGHTEGRCLHGVGHGVMFYSDNNLPTSLELCETLPATSSILYCGEGVFMENFNTDQKTHPSKFLSETDLFYPCKEQKARYKNACYYYAPLHYLSSPSREYSEGLAWCNEAESGYVLQCVRGVAAIAIKQNMSNPALVEALCMQALPHQTPHCIDGMTGLYLNHYNSPTKAYAMCQALLLQNQKACIAAVRVREANFEGEVKGISIDSFSHN